MIKNIYWTICVLGFCLFTGACKKYLDKIPDKSLATPSSAADFWALMDYDFMSNNSTPALNNMGADEYYMTTTKWQAAYPLVRNAYNWQSDLYQGASIEDWNQPYHNIYTANIILNGVQRIKGTTSVQELGYLQGSALFYRAFYFYALQETFGQPYRPESASSDLGIPLRLTEDLNEKVPRASVQTTFEQILSDLKQAAILVPVQVTPKRNRPSLAAVYTLLARVYLTMQQYGLSGAYADSALQQYPTLLDYNTVNATAKMPFALTGNAEVIFQCSGYDSYNIVYTANSIIDSALYSFYQRGDLRKAVLFRAAPSGGTYYFKGNYSGRTNPFSGLATDELYLIKAEVAARNNDVATGLRYLNTLREKRWKSGSYVPLGAVDARQVLQLTLRERRMELVFRGQRWSDLRRLNQDPQLAITLKRMVDGNTYLLPPGDVKYTYPIPDDEIRMAGLQQNPR